MDDDVGLLQQALSAERQQILGARPCPDKMYRCQSRPDCRRSSASAELRPCNARRSQRCADSSPVGVSSGQYRRRCRECLQSSGVATRRSADAGRQHLVAASDPSARAKVCRLPPPASPSIMGPYQPRCQHRRLALGRYGNRQRRAVDDRRRCRSRIRPDGRRSLTGMLRWRAAAVRGSRSRCPHRGRSRNSSAAPSRSLVSPEPTLEHQNTSSAVANRRPFAAR